MRNSSEKLGSSWSTRIIGCLSMRTRAEFPTAVAVAMHTISGETPFPEKATRLQHRDDGFFALLRKHGKFDLAGLNAVHSIRSISLRKD